VPAAEQQSNIKNHGLMDELNSQHVHGRDELGIKQLMAMGHGRDG
jgi:hypothetical protein